MNSKRLKDLYIHTKNMLSKDVDEAEYMSKVDKVVDRSIKSLRLEGRKAEVYRKPLRDMLIANYENKDLKPMFSKKAKNTIKPHKQASQVNVSNNVDLTEIDMIHLTLLNDHKNVDSFKKLNEVKLAEYNKLLDRLENKKNYAERGSKSY
jgi:hypothetical protein